jgi:hypothetical protein
LRDAVEDGLGKRKREDDEARTPKKATDEVSPYMYVANCRIRSRSHLHLIPLSLLVYPTLSIFLNTSIDRIVSSGPGKSPKKDSERR